MGLPALKLGGNATASRLPWRALLGLLLLLPAAAHAAPVSVPEPVAPWLDDDGTGLCIAAAISATPATDFGFLNAGNYNASLNSFMEGHKDDRVELVVRSLLDLSNNNDSGQQLSYGDFVGVVSPACPEGGCDFPVADAFASFGARLRGLINIRPELANQPIHFGFFADDAVSLTFFDKNYNAYSPIIRAPALGSPTWRLTETVTFEQPGLYPIEILYVEIAEHAALEMSYFIGEFEDFQRPANQPPVVPLDTAGFQLFPPRFFFQAISGSPAFPDDLDKCEQCDRQFVNLPGNNACDPGYYCNEAALCAPCDTALFCGPSCSPCGGASPFCIDVGGEHQCAECRSDADCRAGYSCDEETFTCHECNTDHDCDRGKYCVEHTCVDCNTSDSCAGNSCNCCPAGASGAPMQCEALGQGGPPVCVECTSNADCASGVCDVLVGQCVDKLASNQRPDCCGDDCVSCPSDHPFCLPGPVGTACAQCRWDTDCDDGTFCLSGQCQPCTRDQRCGERCISCGGETPYCDGQTPERATCVQCADDSQCPGGSCNRATNECEPVCTLSCPAETPYCSGQACVECYADTHCPCGGTCDPDTNTCSTSCKSNVDCLGVEHCRWNDQGTARECTLGPMPSNSACGGTLATACGMSVGRASPGPQGVALLGLCMLALLFWRRRKGRA